ncbi:6-pyruvoyl trahydropterin synthase family protein [Mycolicibacterium phlei]|uniref:6-pyruvoyl trahydropterin synthase family protein n=1 Tax=Mycolicibacterium phlei TaxID=1771 RepID=UPI00025AE563|nr:6-carboxytetrahydropterin synthase [Mycolicibacterium phlei]EID10199.1 6-pyruvoyl tetrahydrobiopterin synthase [Mycolicibacterium phlei RIVM601174]MBF4194603.1 6-pyruvoyl tetrahydrobiopterin synthase [Mycolicibacterium phlei]
MIIARDFHYDSAHYLIGVPDTHKCSRMHGHTYRLTVMVEGEVDQRGFVMDFADVDAAVKPAIKMLDHRVLNEVDKPNLENPTVENQLIWLWDRLSPSLPLKELILWEGLNNYGRYTGGAPALHG